MGGIPEYFHYLKLGQDLFFPNNFKFLTHQPSSHTHPQRREKKKDSEMINERLSLHPTDIHRQMNRCHRVKTHLQLNINIYVLRCAVSGQIPYFSAAKIERAEYTLDQRPLAHCSPPDPRESPYRITQFVSINEYIVFSDSTGNRKKGSGKFPSVPDKPSSES
jgi:hypothetical protein